MHSTKTLIIACIAVAVVAAGIVLIVWKAGPADDESTPTPTPVAESATPTPAARSYTVRLETSGVTPKTLTIDAGDTVTFLNDTDLAWWPASDPHPAHTDCPGFDALRSLNRGESYTLTFRDVRTCGYHNHVDASDAAQRGTIIVQ